MKHLTLKCLALMTLLICSCSKDDSNVIESDSIEIISLNEFQLRGGNGAPSGSHYTLNLIGVPKDKTADMDNNSGRRIFVKLDGKSRIYLQQGEFDVLDANGTDGRAEFQLPAPGNYEIYARPLGKPGGQSSLQTCATYTSVDAVTGEETSEEVCSTETVISIREANKPKFSNITKELTSITAAFRDLDGDGVFDEETVDLFDPLLEDYLWEYNNQGLKLLQLRFYPI